MNRHYHITIIELLRPLVHIAIIGLLYRIAYEIRLNTNWFRYIDIDTNRVAVNELIIYAILSSIIFVIIGIVKQRYNLITKNNKTISTFFSVRWQWTIVVTCLAYFGHGSIFPYGVSRFIILQVAVYSLILIPIIEYLRTKLHHNRMNTIGHTILLLTKSESTHHNNIIDNLTLPSYYTIIKKNYTWPNMIVWEYDTIILVGAFEQEELQYFIDLTRLQHTQLYHIGDNHFLEDIIYTSGQIGWLQAIRYTASQIEWRAAIIKRIFDTIGASVALIIASPIMIITALVIKHNTPWPIFYTQQRVGKNGKNFTFVKFRSMYTDLCVGKEFGGKKADKLYQDLVNSHANIRKGELPKISNDPRVTKVGKFIRATSIDELPNLFSVLAWDMSLIWPRPHLPTEIANYKPRQRRVLSIKPGITGYAQIHGRDTLSFDEEASKELYYIQNRSLWLDLYIIIATFGVLFGGRGK